MNTTFIISISLIIIVIGAYLKYILENRDSSKFYKSSELIEVVIQVAIVFLGAFLAMNITESMDKHTEYKNTSALMQSMHYLHENSYQQVTRKITGLEEQKNQEKILSDLVTLIQNTSFQLEQETLINDYVLNTLAHGTVMTINRSYGYLDQCATNIGNAESIEEKVNIVATYCFHNALLLYDFRLLQKKPTLNVISFMSPNAPKDLSWDFSREKKEFNIYIGLLEHSFDLDLTAWREIAPP